MVYNIVAFSFQYLYKSGIASKSIAITQVCLHLSWLVALEAYAKCNVEGSSCICSRILDRVVPYAPEHSLANYFILHVKPSFRLMFAHLPLFSHCFPTDGLTWLYLSAQTCCCNQPSKTGCRRTWLRTWNKGIYICTVMDLRNCMYMYVMSL